MEALLQAIHESLLNHDRPVAIAFHIYELLDNAGYHDDDIQEVAAALEDIVN
jgi:DNA-directed RNA polymerase specialized sigma54-like protein